MVSSFLTGELIVVTRRPLEALLVEAWFVLDPRVDFDPEAFALFALAEWIRGLVKRAFMSFAKS